MSVTNCPSCSSTVPPGSVFCDNCGYDLRGVAPAAQPPVPPTFQMPGVGGEITCPQCNHVNSAGSLFCEDCGQKLAPAAPPPAAPQPAYTPPPEYTPPPQPAYTPPAPAAGEFVTGRLVIQAKNASISIPPGKQVVVLGREDPVSSIFPEIDLDPYGAQEDGVGRKHAQIVAQGGQILIEDLGSVNGTSVNRQKIAAGQAHPIQDGDEIRLGKMILIYQAN